MTSPALKAKRLVHSPRNLLLGFSNTMANAFKQHGADGTPRLQVTRPARAAGLVEEDGEGDEKRTTYRAHVRVHAFDGLLLIGDCALEDASWAYLVRKASKYTDSSYRAMESVLQHDGHGYSVALPPATDASVAIGDTPGVHTAPQLLVLTTDPVAKLGREITDFRKDQVQHGTVDGVGPGE